MEPLNKDIARTVAEGLDVDAYCESLAKSGTEHAHQVAFFAWLQWAYNIGRYDKAMMTFAIPNGGERNRIVAAKLKAEGVRPGVPDICHARPLGHYAGLYIELKVQGGRLHDEQQRWQLDLQDQGYAAAVCWGWRAAVACFVAYSAGEVIASVYR